MLLMMDEWKHNEVSDAHSLALGDDMVDKVGGEMTRVKGGMGSGGRPPYHHQQADGLQCPHIRFQPPHQLLIHQPLESMERRAHLESRLEGHNISS